MYRAKDRLILNVPTRESWKSTATYESVEAGLAAIQDRYVEWGILSMAMPALGCGQDGLKWHRVSALIRGFLAPLPIDIEVYGPVEVNLPP